MQLQYFLYEFLCSSGHPQKWKSARKGLKSLQFPQSGNVWPRAPAGTIHPLPLMHMTRLQSFPLILLKTSSPDRRMIIFLSPSRYPGEKSSSRTPDAPLTAHRWHSPPSRNGAFLRYSRFRLPAGFFPPGYNWESEIPAYP